MTIPNWVLISAAWLLMLSGLCCLLGLLIILADQVFYAHAPL